MIQCPYLFYITFMLKWKLWKNSASFCCCYCYSWLKWKININVKVILLEFSNQLESLGFEYILRNYSTFIKHLAPKTKTLLKTKVIANRQQSMFYIMPDSADLTKGILNYICFTLVRNWTDVTCSVCWMTRRDRLKTVLKLSINLIDDTASNSWQR